MQGEIIITELDFTRLNSLINSTRGKNSPEIKNIEVLNTEIKRAKKVDSKNISPEYITMNSVVKLTDMDTGKNIQLKLVYPKEADFRQGHISVFSPLGSALLGFKAGDTIAYEVPKGTKQIRIDEILYQPEASGNFDA
ncbi:MAG: nucleoside diphosphate kinase regulator [Bacteroidales bacterium]|nr:nucleoside diphosphate kinase regulator [Bacteroidales bacterium]